MKTLIVLAAVAVLTGCAKDDNAVAKYGEKSGLPLNCRAYVQVVVDGYREKKFSAEESFAGLERNCGSSGLAWKEHRQD